MFLYYKLLTMLAQNNIYYGSADNNFSGIQAHRFYVNSSPNTPGSGHTENFVVASGKSYFPAGNVGIGTTSPTDKLNINTGAGTFDFKDYNLTYNTSLAVRSESGYLGLVTEGAQDVFISTNGFANKRIVVKSDGKVGIGVTAPTSSVHVDGLQTNSGSTSAHLPTGTMRLNFAGADGANDYGASLVFTQRWWTGSTGEVAMGQIAGVKETGSGNYGGGLAFFTSNNTSNNLLERLRINELGNVGIGTASPNTYSSQTTLTINGSTYGRLDLESAGTLRSSLFSQAANTTLAVSTGFFSLDTSGSERMRIDSSGKCSC